MRVKSLEISGFQIIRQEKRFDFEAPISAIVGPNGSGKSNVAEALRFVLGEQSLKSMRGKRTEDLIFNGSKNTERQTARGSLLILITKIVRFRLITMRYQFLARSP